jgi:hypothetical protein
VSRLPRETLIPPPPSAILSKQAAYRFKWLWRYATLTIAGEPLLDDGKPPAGLAALEQRIDRVGLRGEVEAFLESLAAGRRRWPGGDPYS